MFSQPDDHEWLTWFMGILPKRGTRKLICEILQALYEKRDDDIFTIAQGLFKFLVTKSANKLALQSKDFPASSYVPGSRRPPKDPSQPVSITRCIIEVIDQAFDMGLDKQATGLLDKSCINICQCCPKSGSNSAPDPLIVRDFLLCLFTMLQKHQFTPPTSLKVMFVALLRNILVCNPPECPKPPRGWAHKPRPKCHQYSYPCADCNTLNRFFEDPDMEAGGFRMTLNRQQHLIYQLPDSLYYYQTETNPPKLIVYKLGNEYKQEMHVYKARLTLFEDHVRALRCDYVKSLLSEELYNELVLLKDIPDSDGSMQTKRGEKRKPEEEGDGSSASRPQLIE
ncbi:hypothetical protein F5Y02DRAFT_413659 [Annulohypoxylon stygium]|nr:hypothetical protein F5Y02DRAFT_413659 [Annulohypoxylon stygium]